MKKGDRCFRYRHSRRIACTVLTHVMGLACAPGLVATPSVWGVLGMKDTGVSRNNQAIATMSATGAIYSAGEVLNSGECPPSTRIFGDPSHGGACVTKTDNSGRQIFSVQIGGGAFVEALALDGAGNAYITGTAAPGGTGFPNTPGAYLADPAGIPASFVCKLSASDGQLLFCTFVDVIPINVPGIFFVTAGFSVDSAGNAYIAGTCDHVNICVELLDPTGKNLVYRSNLNTNFKTPLPLWQPTM